MAAMNEQWFKIENLSDRKGIYWFTGPALGVFLGKPAFKKGQFLDLEMDMKVEGVTHFRFLERPKDVDPREWQKAWNQFDQRREGVRA